MENVPVRLIVANGPNLGRTYDLTGDETTIGRSTRNAIVLPLPEISRRHARIWREGISYYVEDLGSTNGTFLNNIRLIEPVLLYDGDEIQVGDTLRLRYSSPADVTRPISIAADRETGDGQPESPGVEPFTRSEPDPEAEIPAPGFSQTEDYYELDEGSSQPAIGPSSRRLLLGCGCLALIMVFICFATLFFLDSYQQGRLLYCGELKPFFQLLLGPVGFNPICP